MPSIGRRLFFYVSSIYFRKEKVVRGSKKKHGLRRQGGNAGGWQHKETAGELHLRWIMIDMFNKIDMLLVLT